VSQERLEQELSTDNLESITQDEVDEFAQRLDEICGTKVTMENYDEVLNSLSVEQIDALNKLGFEAAPAFSLPVTDEMYDEINLSNKIYFSELPNYKIGGKKNAIQDMFGTVGAVPIANGTYEVQGNYRDGLGEREYFEKLFSTRGSQVQKVVAVSEPGYTARQVFYALSDVEVVDDCGGNHEHGILECKAPGICKKCAHKSGFEVEEGQLVGSIISTNLTEGLTQSSLNAIHTGGKGNESAEWQVIKNCLLGRPSSPIIQDAKQEKTTGGARRVIFEGLKEHYAAAGIGIDDYNLEVFAKQLTSFTVDKKTGELSYASWDDLYDESEPLCAMPSANKIGGHNNLFLQSELKTPYSKLTRPGVYKNDRNAVTEIM
jgi:hypothetical protein